MEAPLGCWALGAPCAVGDTVKKKKSLCHPHSWNVMHAVHRVCFKWGGGLFRRARVHGGLGTRGGVCPTEKDEAQNSLPLLLFLPLLQKHTPPLTFFSCFRWEIINDDQSRLFGLWPMRGGGRGGWGTWRELRDGAVGVGRG